MVEGFWQVHTVAAANGLFLQLNDGATQRCGIDGDGTGISIEMNSTAGAIKPLQGFGTYVEDVWNHILLRLTAADVWEFYINGVLKTSWAYTGNLNSEEMTFLSGAGNVNPNKAIACLAVHGQDRYSAGYVTSVIDAFNDV
jgi:hypothetical protein